jgi:hypothetical protein
MTKRISKQGKDYDVAPVDPLSPISGEEQILNEEESEEITDCIADNYGNMDKLAAFRHQEESWRNHCNTDR